MSADVEEEDAAFLSMSVPLTKLPDAMETMVYVQSRWPLIVDTTGQSHTLSKIPAREFLEWYVAERYGEGKPPKMFNWVPQIWT